MEPGVNGKATPGSMWRRLKKSGRVLAGLSFALLFCLISLFCYLLSPDKTPFANRTCLPIGNQPPGFEVNMLRVMENKPTVHQNFFSRLLFGTNSSDIYIPISSSRFEGTDIIVKEFSASGDSSFESHFNIADVVYPINEQKEIAERNGGLFFETADGVAVEESINDIQGFIEGQYLFRKKFILGTDRFGRDVLSRLLVSTRTTIISAFAITIVALIAGFLVGCFAGIFRWGSKALGWIIYSVLSIPGMLLIIALMFVTGNGFRQAFIVAGCVLSAEVAGSVFRKISATREKKFIVNAQALGLYRWQIVRSHLLPGTFEPLLTTGATVFCAAILIENSLSFLGIEFHERVPSWGAIIRENFGYIIVPGYSYLAIFPGIAIIIVSLVFVILSRGLRSTLGVDYYNSII